MSIIKKRHTRTPAYRIAATLIATATTRGNIFAGLLYRSSQLTNLPLLYSILFNKKEPHPYG
jgi:hypothetical protein